MMERWTCPKCREEHSINGKGGHLKWCEKREDHFWSKIDKEAPGGCWLYKGTISFEGYGYVNVGSGVRRKQWQAHRFAWTLLRGPIPEGGCILHTCDIRNCCNPDHLYIGDRAQNSRDKVARGRDNCAMLTPDQVREVKTALLDYKHGLCTKLARQYGVKQGVISDIKLGHTFQHIQIPPFAAGDRK